MKRSIILMMLCVFLIVSFASAEQTVISQIKEVTIFAGQALVKREASATIQKGLNELLLEVQAFHVDKDSVTARVFGQGEIFSVQFKEIPLKESPQENIKALEDKIKELKRSKRVLVDQKEVLRSKESFLASLIDFSKTQIPQELKTSFPDLEELTRTLLFLGSSLEEINKQTQSLDASIERIEEEITVLQAELNALKVPGRKARKVIEVLFNADKDQTVRIEADYLVKNANWGPLYRVSVPLTLSEVDVTMFSKILQKTGENWNQVRLSVSNVIPLSGVRLPSLSSWLLDIPRPQAEMKRQVGRVMYGKAAPAVDAVEAEQALEMPEEEAAFVTAQRRELPLSFEYRIPQSIDIESRDKETILPLFTKKIQGEFYYYSIPKRSALTFLVCKAKADRELLSGPLNVFFGGQYVGKTYLGEKKAGDEFHMSLGADREVKVKREKVRDKVKETYFGKIQRGTIVREMAFKITVENIKERSIVLQVLDSIPVSRTDKIEVKDVSISPEPTKRNYQDREGVMLWEYELAPGERKEITIELVVTYPKEVSPIGL